jgi:hypothetical protein
MCTFLFQVQLLESDLDRTEVKLGQTVQRLELCEKARDDAEMTSRSLENSEQSNFDRLDHQEQALKNAKMIASDAERKFEGIFSNNKCFENIFFYK